MKACIDTATGGTFKWNTTVRHASTGLLVPARITARASTHIHPTRVEPALMLKLNPQLGRAIDLRVIELDGHKALP